MTKQDMITGLNFMLDGIEDDETENIEILEGSVSALIKIDKIEQIVHQWADIDLGLHSDSYMELIQKVIED